jgi:hypothetical protein
MIWQDKAFLAFYFLVIIVVQCFWQKALFKANKPISHFWHGVYYALTALIMAYFFMPVWWKVGLIAVVVRLAFFDPILNLIRGKPLLYNSDPKAASIIDRIENRFSVFWINVLKFFYVAVFIIVIIKLK